MWTSFNFFIGAWKSSGQGRPDHSRVERKYEFVLNGKFIFVENKPVYEPQEKNPNGEIHEAWGIIGYDRARETYVFCQFHIEGFVNQYLLDKIAEDGQSISVEVFELAAPGKGFKNYSESRFYRVRLE